MEIEINHTCILSLVYVKTKEGDISEAINATVSLQCASHLRPRGFEPQIKRFGVQPLTIWAN